jgi:parallel beta-helix repeat protein
MKKLLTAAFLAALASFCLPIEPANAQCTSASFPGGTVCANPNGTVSPPKPTALTGLATYWTPSGTGGVNRTVASTMQERGVTPADYGALPNSSAAGVAAANATAFARAFASSSNVYCKPSDVFYTQAVVIPTTAARFSNCHLVASGTIATSAVLVSSTNNANGIIMDGLTVEIDNGTYPTVSAIAVANGTASIVQNAKVSGGAFGVLISGGSNVVVRDSNINVTAYGVYNNTAATNILIQNNKINGVIGVNVGASSAVRVLWNDITNTQYGIALNDSTNANISGNTSVGGQFGVVVTGGSDVSVLTNKISDFTSYGIYNNAATAGLSIQGNKVANTLGGTGIISETGSTSLRIIGNEVSGGASFGIALSVSSYFELVGNTVYNTPLEGLHINAGGTGVIADNTVSWPASGSAGTDFGMSLADDGGGSPTNVSVTGNTVVNAAKSGIALVGMVRANVAANTIVNPAQISPVDGTRAGILLYASTTQGNTIGVNSITDTTGKMEYQVKEANCCGGSGAPSGNYIAQQQGPAGSLGSILQTENSYTFVAVPSSPSSIDTKSGFRFLNGTSTVAFALRDTGGQSTMIYGYDGAAIGSFSVGASAAISWAQTTHRWYSQGSSSVYATLDAIGWHLATDKKILIGTDIVLTHPVTGSGSPAPTSNITLGAGAGTALNASVLASNTSAYLTAIGFNAAASQTTSDHNTAIGAWALNAVTATSGGCVSPATTGHSDNNTAVGIDSLRGLTTGCFNTGLGEHTLASAVTSTSNTAVGTNAMSFTVDAGTDNTAIGFMAHGGVTVGTVFNTAIGSHAFGAANNTANYNTAVGGYALGGNVAGTGNVGAGYGACGSVTGTGNICLGYQAGGNITSGGANIVIGYGTNAVSATNSWTLNIGDAIRGTGLDTSTPAITLPGGLLTISNTSPTLIIDGSSNIATLQLKRSGAGAAQFFVHSDGNTYFDYLSGGALIYRSSFNGTQVASLTSSGAFAITQQQAIPAGGTAGLGYMFSSTANFGTFFGSGAPTLSAAKGSFYARSDGSTVANRGYINTNGGTTWAPILTGEGVLLAANFPALTGAVTTAGGSLATTLATVNSNVGTFGSATQASQVTVNAKGLVTAAANVTVTPAVGSITGLGTGIATFLGTPSSANLAAAITDETGTGSLVFGTLPTIKAAAGNSLAQIIQSGGHTDSDNPTLQWQPDNSSTALLSIFVSSSSASARMKALGPLAFSAGDGGINGNNVVLTLGTDLSTTFTGTLVSSTIGKTLVLKQGANGAAGTFVCTSGGSVTVSNTNVAVSDAIIISLNTVGGTVSTTPAVSAITAATSFVAKCATSDTSTYNYALIKNAA